MGMGFEIESKQKKSRFNWPVIAQAFSVIVGFICIGLTVTTMFWDDKFNDQVKHHRMKGYVAAATKHGNGTGEQLISQNEIEDLVYRNSPIKKAYCLLISFATLVAIVHIGIYLVFTKEIYRYKFTIQLNFFLAFVYVVAAAMLLYTILENDSNYGRIFKLLRDRGVVDRGQYFSLYIYRYCQVNTGSRDEDKLPPVPDRYKERVEGPLLCQNFSFKMPVVLLSFFNVFFFSTVILTVKSPTNAWRKAIDMAKDLDVEPWMWTHPDGTREFLNEYVYQQERAKYILREIDVEPEKPVRDKHHKRSSSHPPPPPRVEV